MTSRIDWALVTDALETGTKIEYKICSAGHRSGRYEKSVSCPVQAVNRDNRQQFETIHTQTRCLVQQAPQEHGRNRHQQQLQYKALS